jgi:hypothetical protein
MSSLSDVHLSTFARDAVYIYDVFRARWFLMGQRKLENFLGGNPTVLILCFDRALLMQ